MNEAVVLTQRHFNLSLLAIAFIGLVIRMYVASKTYINFDEWQHVFMASSPRWSDLSFELRTNAHPPLFFLLLHQLVKLGSVPLYRAISVAAGVSSIVLVGLIARRAFNSPTLALCSAAAFALSSSAITTSYEIRSYQLAVLLMLLAFSALQTMVSSSDKRVGLYACMVFALCTSLALLSHYSAVFFLAACGIVVLLAARLSLRNLISLAIPGTVFVVEYFVHARTQLMQGYTADYYWRGTPNESAVSFLVRNLQNFFNLFSPIESQEKSVIVLASVVLLTGALWAIPKRPAAKTVILIPIFIVLEIIVASFARKYPFGGLLRHQYVAGPFLLIGVFATIDTILLNRRNYMRYAVGAALLVASVLSLVYQWPRVIIYPGALLYKNEFETLRSAFPNSRAVYLDHWAVIGYFIHTSDQPRHFIRRIADSAEIDEYQTPDGRAIFYDKARDVIDPADPASYRSFAACLRQSKVPSLSLFLFSPGNTPFERSPEKLQALVKQLAADQGLIATGVVATQTSLFADFVLSH